MWKDVIDKRDVMAKRYVDSTRHTIQVDFIPFMDELAELAGCKPNICKYCEIKIKILYKCVYKYLVLLHFQYQTSLTNFTMASFAFRPISQI